MGCGGSRCTNAVIGGGGNGGESHRKSKEARDLRERIVQMLKIKKSELSKQEQKVTFWQILMKAKSLNKTYKRITTVYKSLDANGDGHLDDAELQQMVNELGISEEVTATDLKNIIELCDIDGDRTISLKEFIVALTILYLLKAVPSIMTQTSPYKKVAKPSRDQLDAVRDAQRDDGTASPSPTAAGGKQQVFLGCSNDINYLVHWVVAAYLIFDVDCTGHIDKATVQKMQRQNEKENGSDLFLSEDRWGEIDWDKNGQVDFEEFVFAFSEWIKDFSHDATDDA
ncbi:hypothetical protein CTAYLR_001340 [Chrysophaeum taylorii]|uniref:EF-hand domain-containing protein n=1 Tax=Chrysophaeum taylorii TaxID=2483200 RepID=A0AAD7XHM6_9STRA|nr:hypothetical protein CTAYLR_001340 [Chrysophaeum taylorii]